MLIYEFPDINYSIPRLCTESKSSKNILFCKTYVEICQRFYFDEVIDKLLKHNYKDSLVTYSKQFYKKDKVSLIIFLNWNIQSSVLDTIFPFMDL